MQSFCDLETDQMSAARFQITKRSLTPASAAASAPPRASWLDRLARTLAPERIDPTPLVPRHLAMARELVRSNRAARRCCAAAK